MRQLHSAAVAAIACAAVLGCASSAPAQTTCAGDCGGDGVVSGQEVATAVAIALGIEDPSTCTAAGDGDGVTVDDLVRAVVAKIDSCPASPTATPTSTPTPAPPTSTSTPASPTPPSTPSTPAARFCDLPGSVQTTAPGVVVVPGGPPDAPDLTWLELPIGFCAHFFANVGNVRQVRFAPGGELFVASPTRVTTGGGAGGESAVLVLADDDGDGVAEARSTFLGNLPATQGMLFANGYFYYQDDTRIMRLPYAGGDRAPAGASELVTEITIYRSLLHWPKPLDVADDGTIYVGNGGDQGELCAVPHPFRGGVLALDGTAGGRPVAQGLRNPISIRCARGHNLCFAVELSKDYTAAQGGREKLVPIRAGDDWGFPCCATRDLPYPEIRPIPDCSQVAAENATFLIGDTPFDLDFETGRWPSPWTDRAFVPLHGAYGSWEGARLIAIERDAMTGESLPGSTLTGVSTGSMADFATGWGDGKRLHGRPATVAFAPDGRLFLGNDNDGTIIWIAPLDL